jgi:CubicO group peptidase (beta-lactamase class C family)
MHSRRTTRHHDVPALIQQFRNAHRLPAVAGGVITSSEIQIAAFGSRRLHGPENVTTTDRFHLGSNGKSMTALLIASMVENGRLAWTMALPELFAGISRIHPDWHDVTLAELMTHCSGLEENPGRHWWEAAGTATEIREQVARGTLSEGAERNRGTYAYSNLGYILCGFAAERMASGEYESMLLQTILEPMQVRSAGFGAAGVAGADDQPLGHATKWLLRRSAVEPGLEADNPAFFSPAGRVHMSVNDYATFLQDMLRMMRGENRVLRAGTLQEMLALSSPTDTPDTRYTAAGWLSTERPWSHGPAFTHAGSNTLHYAVAWLAPQRDRALFALTNQGGTVASIAMDELIGALLEFI